MILGMTELQFSISVAFFIALFIAAIWGWRHTQVTGV